MSGDDKRPIPDDHFEKDVSPPGTYPGTWSKEQQERFDAETERLKKLQQKKP